MAFFGVTITPVWFPRQKARGRLLIPLAAFLAALGLSSVQAAEHEVSLSLSSGARSSTQRPSVAPVFLRMDAGWGARDWLVFTISGGFTGHSQLPYSKNFSRYGNLTSELGATFWLYEALVGAQLQGGRKTVWSIGLEVGPQVGVFRPNKEFLPSGLALSLPPQQRRTSLVLLGRWKVVGVERRIGERFSAGAWAAVDVPLLAPSGRRRTPTAAVLAQMTFYFFPSD